MTGIIQRFFCAKDFNDDEKEALKAKKQWVKEMKAKGYTVKSIRSEMQLMSKKGTVYPESEDLEWTKCYGANAWKAWND